MIKKFIIIIVVLIKCNPLLSQWIAYQLPDNKAKLRHVYFVKTETGFVASDLLPSKVWKSVNSGENWEVVLSDSVRLFLGVHFLNKDTGVVLCSGNKIYKTTNGGNNWDLRNFVGGCGSSFFDFDSSGKGYITCGCNTLIKTTDYCETFSEVIGIPWYGEDLRCIDVYDSNIFAFGYGDYNGGSTRLTSTTNDGINWMRSVIFNHSQVESISIFKPTLVCILIPPTIYINQNGFEYFIEYQHTFDYHPRKAKFISDSAIYVIGVLGVIYKTTNLGLTWFQQNSPSTRHLNDIYFLNENTGFIVGDSGTILKTTNGGIVFAGSNQEIYPKSYELSQNYPNPFNPTTKINFALTKQGFVTLKIYDITGREIKTLVNEVKQAGYYSITFSVSDLSSGIYFYRIKAGNYVQTKRMVYIK